jgi:hypothetical protein
LIFFKNNLEKKKLSDVGSDKSGQPTWPIRYPQRIGFSYLFFQKKKSNNALLDENQIIIMTEKLVARRESNHYND